MARKLKQSGVDILKAIADEAGLTEPSALNRTGTSLRLTAAAATGTAAILPTRLRGVSGFFPMPLSVTPPAIAAATSASSTHVRTEGIEDTTRLLQPFELTQVRGV